VHLSRALCAALSVPALVAGVLAAPPAAAVETSTGVRCTVVGTPGADLLVGTAGRDVICGRGGADVIRAKDGNDLVDAGTGSDVVALGGGDDRVLAGPGGDEVAGGSGDDRIAGGDGADHVGGGGGEDVIGGGAGPDVLGGGGAQDDLDGNGGDDTIEGGSGADELDGGVGDNLCIVDAADESIRCRYDETPPVMVETQIDPGTVDVTHASATVTIRVHATDDTGVDGVQVSLYADGYARSIDVPAWLELESGTTKDGWWTTTFEVPRYTYPGQFRPQVYLRDRLDRAVWDDSSPARLVVLDENPDTTPPQLELLAPLGSDPVDVRTEGADITVSVRGTDDLSGVGRLDLCLSPPPSSNGLQIHGICRDAAPRTSGTARNGTWTTTLRVPKGALSGVWNVTARVQDQVLSDSGTWWLGPEAYDIWVAKRMGDGGRPFPPEGAGSVTVIGAADRTPAWVETVTVTPAEVDTLPAAATTHVSVRARDAEGEGVTEVFAVLVSGSARADAPQFDRVDLVRTSGDLVDGVWEGDLVLPQGTPPGTYHVLVGVADIAHARNFVGTSYPHDDHGFVRLDHDPVVVVVQHGAGG
jgi:hypothetical protein